MRREERVTVQGPVKEQQPDGMSHRGGGGGAGGFARKCASGCTHCGLTFQEDIPYSAWPQPLGRSVFGRRDSCPSAHRCCICPWTSLPRRRRECFAFSPSLDSEVWKVYHRARGGGGGWGDTFGGASYFAGCKSLAIASRRGASGPLRRLRSELRRGRDGQGERWPRLEMRLVISCEPSA